jgi:predicted enzyme related to lactoylglutathione lyase
MRDFVSADLAQPMEVPGGDRVVNAMDPQGAAFSLHARKA